MDFALRAFRMNQTCQPLGFSPGKLISDFSSLELYDNKFVLLHATQFVTTAIRNNTLIVSILSLLINVLLL